MADAHYELPELAALYDIDSGWSADREFYLALAGTTPVRVLEIGCGTGIVARAMAGAGHRVTALDPAKAMLDLGRRLPFGDQIVWLEGIAQDFTAPGPFDLIFMTGHAFQVLLDDDDIRATLANIRRHLAAEGIFAFESRNPTLPWETIFARSKALQTAKGPVPIEWRVHWRRGDFIHFDTHYRLPDGERVSESTLRFLTLDRLRSFLQKAGLEAQSVYGDWDRSAFDPASSREIIVIAAPAV